MTGVQTCALPICFPVTIKQVKSYQDLEKNLREELTKKDSEILTLKDENQDLKSELEALKYQLDLKEKRNSSYFGLNKELKEEITTLKEQINALEAQNEVLSSKDIDFDEKIVSRTNIDDLSSPKHKQIKKEDYLKDIVNQYDFYRDWETRAVYRDWETDRKSVV